MFDNLSHDFGRRMRGRYGADSLFRFVLCVAALLVLVNLFVRSLVLSLIALALLIYNYVRFFSRNIDARLRENNAYKAVVGKIASRALSLKKSRTDSKGYVYRHCPECQAKLRLPRRRGHHTVRCPRCRSSFRVWIVF